MSVEEIKAWGELIVPIAIALIGLVNVYISTKVHKLVNSAMTEEKTENALLRGILISKQLELDAAEKVRKTLAEEAARYATHRMQGRPIYVPSSDVPSSDVPLKDPGTGLS